MSKRTTFTTISPLPEGIPREVVIEFLHNHQEMIDLNPLIIERHPIPAPAHASEEEKTRCVWWSLTDRISYLPGGLVSGEIEYTAAFNDLPDGVQTHCYAPMNTDIRERWSLGGTLPGEPLEPVEIGLGAPRQGLYLREVGFLFLSPPHAVDLLYILVSTRTILMCLYLRPKELMLILE